MNTLFTIYRSKAATPACIALALTGMTVQAEVTDWAPVVDPSKGVLNEDPSKQAVGGSLAVLPVPTGGKLYASWIERATDTFHVRVAVYNGILYAAWSENARAGNPYAIRVARYNGNDGAPDWTFIDGNSTAGLNFNSKRSAEWPALVSFGGRLFVFWQEQGGGKLGHQLRARAYSPTTNSWVWVDGGGAAGLNVDPARSAGSRIAPVVHESRDKLYIGFFEFDRSGIAQIRAKVYAGGTSWALADGGATLKLDPAVSPGTGLAGGASAAGLFFTWSEPNAAGVPQVRMSFYDGANDAAPSWVRIDGGHPAVGLNYNPGLPGRGSSGLRVVTFNGKLYHSWLEPSETNGLDQIRIRCWDGVRWAWADGGGPLSTANPFPTRSMGVSGMAVLNSSLYMLSVEESPFPAAIQSCFMSVGVETP